MEQLNGKGTVEYIKGKKMFVVFEEDGPAYPVDIPDTLSEKYLVVADKKVEIEDGVVTKHNFAKRPSKPKATTAKQGCLPAHRVSTRPGTCSRHF